MQRISNENLDLESRNIAEGILSAYGCTGIGCSEGQCFWDLSCYSPAGDKVLVEVKARENSAFAYETFFIGAHKLADFRRYDAKLYEEGDEIPLEDRFDKFIVISIYPGLKKFALANVEKFDSYGTKLCPKMTLWDDGDPELVEKRMLYYKFNNVYDYAVVGE